MRQARFTLGHVNRSDSYSPARPRMASEAAARGMGTRARPIPTEEDCSRAARELPPREIVSRSRRSSPIDGERSATRPFGAQYFRHCPDGLRVPEHVLRARGTLSADEFLGRGS